jgi:hypothetical protein
VDPEVAETGLVITIVQMQQHLQQIQEVAAEEVLRMTEQVLLALQELS